MKQIKYTGYSESIDVYIDKLRTFFPFKRNTWKEVSDEVAEELLKNPHWISKDDYSINLSILKEPITLGLFRFGAMGDLIQLIPIARFIKREYKHRIVLITQRMYLDFFSRIKDAFDEVYSNEIFHRDKYDKLVYLDGVLEMDHSIENSESKLHRIKIYEQFFNIKPDYYDFSIPISESDNKYVEEILNASL